MARGNAWDCTGGGATPPKNKDKRKHYRTYVEKDEGRDELRDDLAEAVRSHYDRLERIAEDVERLGCKVAARPTPCCSSPTGC